MKYSIVVPVYNRPDEVDELLESLCSQTLKDFEVIVVEDGSQKPCKDVCDKYASILHLHYYYKENSGPGQSRNYGVERAQGEYVIILDSDENIKTVTEPEYKDKAVKYCGGDIVEKKPVIYLYPTEETDVDVELGAPEKLTVSYPKYDTAWKVTASPDGKLVDRTTGRKLYSLYYETDYTSSKGIREEGFVVKGADSAKFLEEKLAQLGLNEYEAEEFIVYWLPQLEKNAYNYIYFAPAAEIAENMPFNVSPAPATVIRINMEFKALDAPIQVKEQQLPETPVRQGFTLVEWGGTIL